MDEIVHKKNKIYYSIGEVAEMFDVNPSLIRFWEKKFDIIKPHKNKKGNRMFTPKDVDSFKLIYHLVKERGMTLSGAQQRLKDNKEGTVRNMEIVDRLLAIRSMLVEIREELKKDGEIFSPEGYLDEEYLQETADVFPGTDAGASADDNTHGHAVAEDDDLITITAEVSTEIVTDGSSPWDEPEEDGEQINAEERNSAMEELRNVKDILAGWNDISQKAPSEDAAQKGSSSRNEEVKYPAENINGTADALSGLGNIFDDELDAADEYADPWEEIEDESLTGTVAEDDVTAIAQPAKPKPEDVFGTDACTTFSPDDMEAAANAGDEEPQEPKRPGIYEQTLF